MNNMARQTLSRFGLKGGGVDACEGLLSDGAPTHVKRDQAAEQVNGAVSSTSHGAETRGSGHMHGHDSSAFERDTGAGTGTGTGTGTNASTGGHRDTTDDRDMLRVMRDTAHADQRNAAAHDKASVAQRTTGHGDRTAGSHQTGKDAQAEESMYHMTEDQLKFAKEKVGVRPHPHMTLEKGVGNVDDAKADTATTTGGLKGGNPYHYFGGAPGATYGSRGLRGGSDDKAARTNTNTSTNVADNANVGSKDAHVCGEGGEGGYHMTEDQLKFAKEKVEVRPHPHMTLDKNVGSSDDVKTDTSKASGGLKGGNPYHHFGHATGGGYGGRGLRGGSDDKSAQTHTSANAAASKATGKDAHAHVDAGEGEGMYHMTEDQLKFAKEKVEVRPHPHMTLDKNVGESADDVKTDPGKASGGLKGGNPYHHFGHVARGSGDSGHGLRGGSDDKSARVHTDANAATGKATGKDAHALGDENEGSYHMTEDQLQFAKEKVEVRPHPHMTLDKNVGSADDVKTDTSKASGGLKGGSEYAHFGHVTGEGYSGRGLRGGSDESKQAQQAGQQPGRHDAHVCGEGTGPFYHLGEEELGHRKEQIGVGAHPHMPLHPDEGTQGAPPDRDSSKPSKGQLTAVADTSADASTEMGASAKTLFDKDSSKPTGTHGSTATANAPTHSQGGVSASGAGESTAHQQQVPKPSTERKPSTAAATAGAGAAALRQAARVGTAPTQSEARQPSSTSGAHHDAHATHQHLDVGAGTTGVSKASLNAITGDVNDTFFDTGAGKSVGSALNEEVAESSFSAARTAGDDMGVDTDALHREGADEEHSGGLGGTGATRTGSSSQSTLITEDSLKDRPPRSRGTRLEVDRGEEGRGFDPVQRNIPQPHYSSFRDAQRAEAEGAGVDSGERWDSGRGTASGRSSGTSGKLAQTHTYTHARTRGMSAAQRERTRGREEKHDGGPRAPSRGVSGAATGMAPGGGRARRRRGVPRDTTKPATRADHAEASSVSTRTAAPQLDQTSDSQASDARREGAKSTGDAVDAGGAGSGHGRAGDSGLRESAHDPSDHFRDVGVSVRGDDGIGGADADYRRLQCTLAQCLKHRGLAAYSMPSTRGGAEMSVGHNAARWHNAFGSRGMALLLGRLAGEYTGPRGRRRGAGRATDQSIGGNAAADVPTDGPTGDPAVVVEHTGGTHMDASDTSVTTGAWPMPSAETSAVDTRGVVDQDARAKETNTPRIHAGRLVGARDRRLNMFETRRTSSDRAAREGFLPLWHRENSAGEDRVGPVATPVAAGSLSPAVVSGVAPAAASPPLTAVSPCSQLFPALAVDPITRVFFPLPPATSAPRTAATHGDTHGEAHGASADASATSLLSIAPSALLFSPVSAHTQVLPLASPVAPTITPLATGASATSLAPVAPMAGMASVTPTGAVDTAATTHLASHAEPPTQRTPGTVASSTRSHAIASPAAGSHAVEGVGSGRAPAAGEQQPAVASDMSYSLFVPSLSLPTQTPATATSRKQALAPHTAPPSTAGALAASPRTPVTAADAATADTLEHRVTALEERVTALEGVTAALLTQAPVVSTSRVAPSDAPFATILTSEAQARGAETGGAASEMDTVLFGGQPLEEGTEEEVEEEVEEARQALESLHVSDQEEDSVGRVRTSKHTPHMEEEKQQMRSN